MDEMTLEEKLEKATEALRNLAEINGSEYAKRVLEEIENGY